MMLAWDVKWIDHKTGKWKKHSFQMTEFAGGALSGLTGGATDLLFRTLNGALDIVERHSRKIDGLVVLSS